MTTGVNLAEIYQHLRNAYCLHFQGVRRLYLSTMSHCGQELKYQILCMSSWRSLTTGPYPHPNRLHQRWRSSASSIIFQYLLVSLRSSSSYLLTPWCRVLLEKLTGLQLVKKFPAFHGTRRFITAITSVRHLSLSRTISIQSIYPHPTSWRSILILSTHLRLGLPSGLFPSGFPTKTLTPPLLTHTRHMPSPSHSSRFYHPHNIGWGVQII